MIDRKDIDLTAAEYVLGTLNGEERTAVSNLRMSLTELDAAITDWQNRLAPLNMGILEAAPASDLFAKIERRIDALSEMPASPQPDSMKRSILRWRITALAACIALAIVSVLAFYRTEPRPSAPHPIAVLQGNAAPAFIVSLDEKQSTLAVRAVSTAAPQDKVYELWLIADGTTSPRALSVLPDRDTQIIHLEGADAGDIRHATLAVSIEPQGGSPTGAPTGPVVFTGKFL